MLILKLTKKDGSISYNNGVLSAYTYALKAYGYTQLNSSETKKLYKSMKKYYENI